MASQLSLLHQKIVRYRGNALETFYKNRTQILSECFCSAPEFSHSVFVPKLKMSRSHLILGAKWSHSFKPCPLMRSNKVT